MPPAATAHAATPPDTIDVAGDTAPPPAPPVIATGGVAVVESIPASTRGLQPMKALGWMLLACFLFALMNLAAKRAMGELPWHEVAAGRAAFGAITIYAWARARGISLAVHARRTQWMRTLAGIGGMTCGFFALSRLTMGDAVTLANVTPLLVAIASWRFLRERSGKGLGVAMVLGFFGVAVLAGAHLETGRAALVGMGMAVLAACFSCVAMLFLRRLGPHESAEGVSLHFVGWAAPAMFVVGLGHHVLPSPAALTSLVLAGLTGGAAQIAMTKAYGLDKAARVGGVGYSGVVMSQVLAVLVLHEAPTLQQIGGAALVVTSGVVMVMGALREQRARVAA
jgi:drug/metabolite transporter (DMT)-like permease